MNIYLISSEDNTKHKITCSTGLNLMEVINGADIPNISVFGVCNKQLACHSCAVQVVKNYCKLPKPTEGEQDVHSELGELFEENKTRMSCQIEIDENMDEVEIEIPRSAFFMFNQDNNDNDKI